MLRWKPIIITRRRKCKLILHTRSLLTLASLTSHPAPQKLQTHMQCILSGCDKRFKNVNGLKYHLVHAHSAMTVGLYLEPPLHVSQGVFVCALKTTYS